MLADEGYQVETLDNFSDALEKLAGERYDLILADIKMQGMGGIELYKNLQKTAQSLAKKIVFITGDVIGEDTWKFLREAKVPYLTKPFVEKQLLNEIDRKIRQAT